MDVPAMQDRACLSAAIDERPSRARAHAEVFNLKGAGHGRAPVKAGGRAGVVNLPGAVAGLLLCLSCATDTANDRLQLARAALAEAYVRQLCPAIELDGGVR
jgi:hypothetical protein